MAIAWFFLGVIGYVDLAYAASKNGADASIAPDFTLKSKSGSNMRLSEQKGNIVLVNFWASWCGPCRAELPEFEKMQQDYEDLGFTVMAVNVDDDSRKADVLLRDIKVSFPVLFDPEGDVSKLYDVSAMPTTVVIDRDGKQRLLHKGYKRGDEKKYRQLVKALMRE
ncbi:TlpA family protein disulfide reductase [Alteromonadaceae bacterium M269]|nr:TlpA family protein disulfide reductase [Alteromonadaceae bacterium M269]